MIDAYTVGQMRGELNGVNERLNRIETVVDRIDARLDHIEDKMTERTGAWKLAVGISGIFGSVVTAIGAVVIPHFWK